MPSYNQVPGGPSTPIKPTQGEAETPTKASSPFNKAKSPVKSKNSNATTTKNRESKKPKNKQEPSQSKKKGALWANTTVPEVKPDDYDFLVEHQKWLFHHMLGREECDTLATFWVTNNAELRPIDQCLMSSNVHDLSVIDWILRCQPKAPMTQDVNDAIMKLKTCIEISRNGRDLFQYSVQAALMINRFHLRKAIVFFLRINPFHQPSG
jgi:hypothetical protein